MDGSIGDQSMKDLPSYSSLLSITSFWPERRHDCSQQKITHFHLLSSEEQVSVICKVTTTVLSQRPVLQHPNEQLLYDPYGNFFHEQINNAKVTSRRSGCLKRLYLLGREMK
ncbi:uncharacterized protein LOC135369305 isoform X2 [Ornithodoros turicata]|uniref:uncharacterized protein LOC135369305 isoform X2 n=2 Tax=Ornithodoros turicata TaxID=34597 RepID=UPI0031388BF3